MTAIDHTAYPRPGSRLTREELRARYTLTETDLTFVRLGARGEIGRLTLATLLKARQDLGYFPTPDELHADTTAHLALQLGLTVSVSPAVTHKTKSLYRYQAAVRSYLSVTHYDDVAEGLVTKTILETAETMSDPADLINQAVETLQAASIDLPAFSSLDRLVNRLRAEVHARIYNRVLMRVTPEHTAILDALLVKPANSTTTSFNRLKQTPGPATPTTIRLWIERLDWLAGLIDPDPLLEGVAHTKLRQFASEAAALEVSELLDISQPGKRHTLLLALLRQARMRCRDELVEMMLRRVRRTQAAAKEQLEAMHDRQRETEEALIGIFGQVLQTAQAQEADDVFGRQVRQLLAEQGGVEALALAKEPTKASAMEFLKSAAKLRYGTIRARYQGQVAQEQRGLDRQIAQQAPTQPIAKTRTIKQDLQIRSLSLAIGGVVEHAREIHQRVVTKLPLWTAAVEMGRQKVPHQQRSSERQL